MVKRYKGDFDQSIEISMLSAFTRFMSCDRGAGPLAETRSQS